MQLTAKLIQVLPVQTGMGKNGEWRKQSIILETDGMYPKKVCMTFWGDKINESVLQIGNILDVSFDIESREYNGNWYTDLRAWKVDPAGAAAPSAAPGYGASNQPAPAAPPVDFSGDSGDDLPF
ncbi:DUF3127 domain-containing protein [Dysgonomonas sp. Marseille-P4677]|uniref:DUF3127 domain-containing protein n=1 Tax=Dysgonomonas sp. Marseille-P4677 TaxID=2364790 RepID=UPI001914B010|nr:DUF3127 domain-containing protein [Dysgonomonas sp. Marseille-P4677]MBK5720760.1 DUF3127 domain-containing protein [Dysgonomonas sp. Marseille-P4677]